MRLEGSIEQPAGRTLPPGCLGQRPPSKREVQVKVKGLGLILNLILTLTFTSLSEGGGTEGDGGSSTTFPPPPTLETQPPVFVLPAQSSRRPSR